jgi:hypothetical protein
MNIDQLNIPLSDQETFFYWIQERDSIRQKKEAGLPKPWTDDPIFQKYKFCNVRREDDKVTVWIKNYWRDPCRGHPNMWFAMIVARLFNWPETLNAIDFPLADFDKLKETWRDVLKRRREAGLKIFTGAYLVSTNGVSMDKLDYILDRVLTPIWERGNSPQSLSNTYFHVDGALTLQEYWNHLIQFDGLGSFMAGQVIADLKYVDPVLEKASDWWTWAPLGPGSIRGLNRFAGRDYRKPLNQKQGLHELLSLQQQVEERLGIKLPVHDVQNCCCEFDKYLRLKKGEGKVRSGYNGVK